VYGVAVVKVYGSMELVKSDWLELQTVASADPPTIAVAVIGLDERRQLERNVCDLINKRDRSLTHWLTSSYKNNSSACSLYLLICLRFDNRCCSLS